MKQLFRGAAGIAILFVYVPLVYHPDAVGVALGCLIYKLAGILQALGEA
jgi:hypothetical protein